MDSMYWQKIRDSLTELQRTVHALAITKGWYHDEYGIPLERNFGEQLALVHSEISEALEAYRNGAELNEELTGEGGKPEGVPLELADAVIRIFDLCGANNIDLARAIERKYRWNEDRPFRHGGKRV
jgi:hypothetical protein